MAAWSDRDEDRAVGAGLAQHPDDGRRYLMWIHDTGWYSIDPDQGRMLIAGQDGVSRYIVNPDQKDFAPRVGVARRAFDMLCERSLYRYAHGSVLAQHETVQNWIADSAAEMSAARLMTLHAAWVIDTKGAAAARKEISLIKFFGAKVLHDVIDRSIQVHGSLGYSADMPLEEMYRTARGARFYDGPDEVHRVSVARQVLTGYKAPQGMWPSEHVPTRRAAAQRKFAALLEAATTDV